MFVDSHAHLFFEDFRNDLPEVLARARVAGVGQIVVPGTDLATSFQAVALAERTPGVFACVGIHPHESAKADKDDLKKIDELAAHPKVVAIGEIGLDFYYDFSPRPVQAEYFKTQLEIAARRDLPVVIHTRESLAETVDAVDKAVRTNAAWRSAHRSEEGRPLPSRGVFHCFPGTSAQARHLRGLGFFVSYPGIVTFKKSNALATLLETGYENILLETDSPYLAPVPLRGKRNEPAHVAIIAEHVAQACGVSVSDVAAATTRNAAFLFDLPTTLMLE